MPYNTGNPLGSSDARDLFDNAAALDQAMNSTGPTWTDRLGVIRPTFSGAESELNALVADAAASAAEAAATADSLDDRWLGAKESDPATDNDGNALQIGAGYYNTTLAAFRIYGNTGWYTPNVDGQALAEPSGATLIGDIASGTDAVADTQRAINEEVISVFRFMTPAEKADVLAGTGVVDVTSALRKALVGYAWVSSSSGGAPASGSKPKLHFPRGRYSVTADISNGIALNYLSICADNAIIEAAAGITVFGKIRYMIDIDGLTIRGGAVAYSLVTGNVDTNVVRIRNGECINQTTACIAIDNNSASTLLIVDRMKLVPAAGGKVLSALSGDIVTFNDCWGTVDGAIGAFDVTGVKLVLNNFVGVPGASLSSWVDLRAGSRLYSENSRFGGEAAGADWIVRNYASADTSYPVNPVGFSLEGGESYAATSIAKFFALPNFVNINTAGFSDTPPMQFDSSISAADLAVIGSANWCWKVYDNMQAYVLYADPTVASTPVAAANGVPLTDWYQFNSSIPNTADLVLQSAADTGSYVPSQTATNATPASVTDEHGVATKRYTATANGASASLAYTMALDGLPASIYTAVFDVEVTSDHVVWPKFSASNTNRRDRALPRGKHTVCIPFYYDGGAAKTIGISILNLPNGAIVEWRRFRVFLGVRSISTTRSVVSGSSAPVSGQWYKGDEVQYPQPASGGARGVICTAAGGPGTWKTWGALA